MFKVPEKYRNKTHPILKSDSSYSNNGYFVLSHPKINNYEIHCIASNGMGWEYVSVSIAEKRKQAHRYPTWAEMCYVKSIFWDKEDCCIQFHPKESEYVNNHPFVLHIWRPTNAVIQMPDPKMVGVI